MEYAIIKDQASGEVYAAIIDGDAITALCGPLHWTEQDANFSDYNYEPVDDDMALDGFAILS